MLRQCPLEAVPREPRTVPGLWWDLPKHLVGNKREKKILAMKLGEGISEHSTYLSPPLIPRILLLLLMMRKRLSSTSSTSIGDVIQARKRTMIYGGNYSHCCKP